MFPVFYSFPKLAVETSLWFPPQLFPQKLWTVTTACLYPFMVDNTSIYYAATENTET